MGRKLPSVPTCNPTSTTLPNSPEFRFSTNNSLVHLYPSNFLNLIYLLYLNYLLNIFLVKMFQINNIYLTKCFEKGKIKEIWKRP